MNKPAADPRTWTAPGRLGRDVQARIGEQLRKMHEDVIRQGVPDRFVELLSKIDAEKPDKE